MPGKRLRILINPAAREGRSLPALRQPVDALDIEWVECASGAELQDRVRQAQGEALDALAVAGGDGTVALALNALEALNRVPLGIVPTGARNDFARNLGIPTQPAEALQLLGVGQPHRVDVVRATWPGWPESRRCLCAASLGLAERALRRLHGSRWACWPALQACVMLPALWGCPPRRLRVGWRDGTFEGEVLAIAVANTRGFSGLVLSPEARTNDGLLDLCLFPHTGRLQALTQISRLLQGTHAELPGVITAQTPWVRVEGIGEEIPVALDDALAGVTTPVELHCEPAAVQLLLPQVQAEAAVPELTPQALPAFEGGV